MSKQKDEINKIINKYIYSCSIEELLKLFQKVRKELDERTIVEQEGWCKTWNIKEEKDK